MFFLFTLLCSVSASSNDVLNLVNTLRLQNNVPNVTYNNSLSEGASLWAKHMVSVNTLVHSNSNNTYGENLGFATNVLNAWSLIINDWYAENSLYSYISPGFSSSTGHFTQLVWKHSTQIGFAQEVDETSNLVYFVMWFYPKGNIKGEFSSNVLPPVPVSPKQSPSPTPSPTPPTPNPPSPSLNSSPWFNSTTKYTCQCTC